MIIRNVLALIWLLALCSNTCLARGVHIPSYDELFTKSDVILIVRPGKTLDARANDVTQPRGVSGLEDFVTAVVTPLKILRVVKGDGDGSQKGDQGGSQNGTHQNGEAGGDGD